MKPVLGELPPLSDNEGYLRKQLTDADDPLNVTGSCDDYKIIHKWQSEPSYYDGLQPQWLRDFLIEAPDTLNHSIPLGKVTQQKRSCACSTRKYPSKDMVEVMNLLKVNGYGISGDDKPSVCLETT